MNPGPLPEFEPESEPDFKRSSYGAQLEIVEMFDVTREWLDSVSDSLGLTNGQQTLLNIHAGDLPWVGKTIPAFVARFIGKCRGYRGISPELRAWIGY